MGFQAQEAAAKNSKLAFISCGEFHIKNMLS
jgi:hypothetical protein